jgi:hypothetical protein
VNPPLDRAATGTGIPRPKHVAINKTINKYFGINLMSILLFPIEIHEGICGSGSTALVFLTSALDRGEGSN